VLALLAKILAMSKKPAAIRPTSNVMPTSPIEVQL
jgi:hypothetical protein